MQAVRSMVLVSSDPQSMQAGAQEVYTRLQKEIQSFNLEKEISLSMINDIGRHDSIPMVIVYPEAVIYGPVKPDDVHFLVEEHLYKGTDCGWLAGACKGIIRQDRLAFCTKRHSTG